MRVTVRVYKNQINHFRRKARSNPNEILAHLYGTRTFSTVTVDHFFYPKLILQTPTAVQADYWLSEHKGVCYVGSIHSHPNAWPMMSEADWVGAHTGGDIVSGICEVRNGRTAVCWWTPHSSLKCDWEYRKER